MTTVGADSQIKEAVRLLKGGGLIAYPTETYYALGVDPFNSEALRRLFAVKQRTIDKPILLLVAEQTQVVPLAEYVPGDFDTLMAIFWPGPLTLVFPARLHLPELLTGGTGTVGIRRVYPYISRSNRRCQYNLFCPTFPNVFSSSYCRRSCGNAVIY